MTKLNVMAARTAFSKTINRVAFGREHIVLERRGEDVAALLPVEDFRLFERLLREYEDRTDLEDARRAMAEPGSIPFAELRKELEAEDDEKVSDRREAVGGRGPAEDPAAGP